MKNKLKIFYVLLIAIVSVFWVGEVSATTTETACENAGGEVITVYYLFLDVESADYTPTNSSYITSAPFYNTITYNNDNTEIITNTLVDLSSESLLLHFWSVYLSAQEGKDSTTGVWVNGDVTYVTHNSWRNETTDTSYSSTDVEDLLNYISQSTISDLYNNGTIYPTTVATAVDITVTSEYYTFYITRYYTTGDTLANSYGKTGTTLGGALSSEVLYAPAMYEVQYCDYSNASTEYTITYYYNLEEGGEYVADDDPYVTTVSASTCEDILSLNGAGFTASSGYTFLGWSTSSTATSATYTAGDEYCGGTNGTTNLVLYGVWEEDSTTTTTSSTYSVKYDANGGSNAPATQTASTGTCVYISTTTPTLSGSTFLGWSTSATAAEADSTYAPGAKYCDDKDITLYAVWQVKTGVSAHLIAFTLVALTAVAALVVAKKKDLFRQI